MGRFSKIFYGNFFITTLTCVFGCGNAFGIYYSNPEINRLIAEKQDKVAQLETCAKKVKGFKIAGISTIGLTTVGVGANIVMASKESQLSDELERARGKLNEKKWNEQQQALEEARRNQNAPSGDGDVHIRLGGNNSSSSDVSVTVTIPVVPGNSGNGTVTTDNKSNTSDNNGQVHSGNDANTEKPDDGKPADNGNENPDNKSNTNENNGQVHSGNDDNTPVQNDGEQQITPPKNEVDNKSETNQVESSDNNTPSVESDTNGGTGQTQSNDENNVDENNTVTSEQNGDLFKNSSETKEQGTDNSESVIVSPSLELGDDAITDENTAQSQSSKKTGKMGNKDKTNKRKNGRGKKQDKDKAETDVAAEQEKEEALRQAREQGRQELLKEQVDGRIIGEQCKDVDLLPIKAIEGIYVKEAGSYNKCFESSDSTNSTVSCSCRATKCHDDHEIDPNTWTCKKKVKLEPGITGNGEMNKGLKGQTESSYNFTKCLNVRLHNNGDWCAQFDDFIVKGTSACVDDATHNNDKEYTSAKNQNIIPGNFSYNNDEKYCYCKITSWQPYGLAERNQQSDWIFVREFSSVSQCGDHCTDWLCSINLLGSATYQESIFKSVK